MEYIFVWLMFGLASAIVAHNKGNNGFGWLIIGVLLGPFGLILALVGSKNIEAVEKKSVDSGVSRKCPFCAELIKREAIVCRFCGRDLPLMAQQTNIINLPTHETQSQTFSKGIPSDLPNLICESVFKVEKEDKKNIYAGLVICTLATVGLALFMLYGIKVGEPPSKELMTATASSNAKHAVANTTSLDTTALSGQFRVVAYRPVANPEGRTPIYSKCMSLSEAKIEHKMQQAIWHSRENSGSVPWNVEVEKCDR